ncbi:GvpL/GvpF family gas vesicle protein [Actinacidiphila acididurans]|uniref:GvpL/GvpF family gas vesicle protein n=1 Tax=Actinacidiphila acididurans TaxID=2784346 RepID=A0ABS2U109_9ACTN|nr:GvpL/GvpF family gas vesicle protein [Actinacidiphila acididurans]MBM9507878.1 GvpL/GvpF family gas vesicle protein [Actinacidiphila acididurans]
MTSTAAARSTSLLCVFAICRSRTAAGLPAELPTGLPAGTGHARGGPLTVLPIGDSLAALVQEVPAEEFTEQALQQRLADQSTLEACARAHHAAVSAAAALGPVVPLPLATLFTDRHRARSVLAESLERFHRVLNRTEGRVEWAVKVHLRRDSRPAAEPSPPEPAPAGPGAGRAYLSRVRGREQDRLSRQDAARAAAARVHDAVRGVAAGSVQRRPHGPRVTGNDRLQVMNAAYLVEEARGPELAALVRIMREEVALSGVDVDLSGPWVPYSFAEDVEDAEDAELAGERT